MVAATVSGAGAWPAATRVSLDGAATQAHMIWFAKQAATGVTLYQAALYGKQPSNEAITTFFESLQLQ
jgi:spore germination cell wall hydrolase CwlJ-like protein